jgi:hypothetical protein
VRNRWLRRGAITLHVMAVLVVGVCLAGGWWQLERALSGNGRSWAYTVEWPFFAAYAGWMWWKLLHDEPGFAKEEPAAEPPSEDERPAPSPENDVTRT